MDRLYRNVLSRCGLAVSASKHGLAGKIETPVKENSGQPCVAQMLESSGGSVISSIHLHIPDCSGDSHPAMETAPGNLSSLNIKLLLARCPEAESTLPARVAKYRATESRGVACAPIHEQLAVPRRVEDSEHQSERILGLSLHNCNRAMRLVSYSDPVGEGSKSDTSACRHFTPIAHNH
jgi:hypothetical protein